MIGARSDAVKWFWDVGSGTLRGLPLLLEVVTSKMVVEHSSNPRGRRYMGTREAQAGCFKAGYRARLERGPSSTSHGRVALR